MFFHGQVQLIGALCGKPLTGAPRFSDGGGRWSGCSRCQPAVE
jgi:hypothetical protein